MIAIRQAALVDAKRLLEIFVLSYLCKELYVVCER